MFVRRVELKQGLSYSANVTTAPLRLVILLTRREHRDHELSRDPSESGSAPIIVCTQKRAPY